MSGLPELPCADAQERSPQSPSPAGGRELLTPADKRERPSRHGALLGEVLAALADEGRRHAPELPEMCATCAFRSGCMTNQMASTGIVALNCILGIDTDRFACHHGMRDGDPQKLCAGYIAALLAPWDFTVQAMELLTEQLAVARDKPDTIRAEFDAWIAEVDPHNRMDDYQRGRAFFRAKAARAASTQPSSPQEAKSDLRGGEG